VPPGFAPRQRGAWIETPVRYNVAAVAFASLPGNGERGLKLVRLAELAADAERFAPRQRGAWIETAESISERPAMY